MPPGPLGAAARAAAPLVANLPFPVLITALGGVLLLLLLAAYVSASRSLAPAIRDAPPPPAGGITPLPPDPVEAFCRSSMIGVNAALNFGLWVIAGSGWGWGGFTGAGAGAGGAGAGVAGAGAGVITLAAAFPALSRRRGFQTLLGWASWAMPMSWPVLGLGLALFVLNLIGTVVVGRRVGVRIDFTSATIETAGGLTGITGFIGGFNLGSFSFITPGAATSPFHSPGLSNHEAGHTLNVAAFGWVFHLINAVDENVPPFDRGPLAYAELLAESHVPRQGKLFVRQWA